MNRTAPPGVDPGQVGVIRFDDFSRIRSLANKDIRIVDKTTSEERKEQLHAMSQSRVKNWGNTLDAQRTKKERRLQEKAEEEERQRCIIDAEEAQYQAEQRRNAIERANKILYDANDRVKSFNSKILLSDVLMEREKQLQLQKEKEGRSKHIEEVWHQKHLEQLSEFDRKEAEKVEKMKQKMQEAQQMRTEQLEVLKHSLKQTKKEEYEEGQLIRKKAALMAEQMKQRELEKKKKFRDDALKTIDQNKLLDHEKKETTKRLQEAEEEMIRRFAEEKEAQMRERNRREKEVKDLKMEQRRQMIEVQEKHLEALMANAETRLTKQVQEKADLDAELEAKAEARRQRELAAVAQSHNEQLAQRSQYKEKKRMSEKELAEQIRLRNELLVKEEELAKLNVLAKAKDIQSYHKRQMEIKEKKAQRVALEKMADANDTKVQQEDEDMRYLQYTATMTEHYKQRGMDVKPMVLELQKQKKRESRLN